MRDYARILWLVCFALSAGALVVPAIAGTPVPGVTDPNQVVQYSTDGGKSWKSVRSDASGTFYIPVDENATRAEYGWFATKTEPANLRITSPENGFVLERISDVVVTAGDMTHRRFSERGVLSVELYIDGAAVESPTINLRPDCVQYTFHAGSLGLRKGLHKLEAVARDDFWQTTRWRAQVYVKPEGGRPFFAFLRTRKE